MQTKRNKRQQSYHFSNFNESKDFIQGSQDTELRYQMPVNLIEDDSRPTPKYRNIFEKHEKPNHSRAISNPGPKHRRTISGAHLCLPSLGKASNFDPFTTNLPSSESSFSKNHTEEYADNELTIRSTKSENSDAEHIIRSILSQRNFNKSPSSVPERGSPEEKFSELEEFMEKIMKIQQKRTDEIENNRKNIRLQLLKHIKNEPNYSQNQLGDPSKIGKKQLNRYVEYPTESSEFSQILNIENESHEARINSYMLTQTDEPLLDLKK